MNIWEARRQAAERTAKSINECERDGLFSEDAEALMLWLDKQKLRGIPAVGRGVSGHISGSDPLEALLDKYPDEDAA